MSPSSHSDGRDGLGLCDEAAPSVAGSVNDVVVGVEDAVRQPVATHVLPNVLNRVELRGARGQEQQGQVLRNSQGGGGVQAGAVEQENGVGTFGDIAGDLVEVDLHGLGVGGWH